MPKQNEKKIEFIINSDDTLLKMALEHDKLSSIYLNQFELERAESNVIKNESKNQKAISLNFAGLYNSCSGKESECFFLNKDGERVIVKEFVDEKDHFLINSTLPIIDFKDVLSMECPKCKHIHPVIEGKVFLKGDYIKNRIIICPHHDKIIIVNTLKTIISKSPS